MWIQDVIRKTRDGVALSESEISRFISSFLRNEVADYQMSAWLMAVCCNELDAQQTSILTRLMRDSGKVLSRENTDAFRIDKHSTGGVGDKTSLILVPLVLAAARKLWGSGSIEIPMVSGRGLGHTQGTLDKLEAIPGFQVRLSLADAEALLRKRGGFIIGQTEEFVPADRRIYALRDTTGTVDSISLIVASILSKKLAEGLDGFVLDVKCGKGAFFPDIEKTRQMAKHLFDTASEEGVATRALLTSQDEPLGFGVGHSLEVKESWDFVRGKTPERGLNEVTLALASSMLLLSSKGSLDVLSARKACTEVLENGDAAREFEEFVAAQGGDLKRFEKEVETHGSRHVLTIEAPRSGFLKAVDARQIAEIISFLGGGRQKIEDDIDPWVGLELNKKVGDVVEKGEVLTRIVYRESTQKEQLQKDFLNAIEVVDEAVTETPWVGEVLE